MSQAKVDRYKEEKKNRAKIMAKEKREWTLTKLAGGILALAVVAWAGYSAVTALRPSTAEETTLETENYTVDTTALDDYINSLTSD